MIVIYLFFHLPKHILGGVFLKEFEFGLILALPGSEYKQS